LEALMRFLTACDVLARLGHGDDGNVVIVAAQEVLRARDDVAYDDRSAKGIQDVLVVRVQDEAFRHLACKVTLGAYLGSR
jgi:hypothetical protein